MPTNLGGLQGIGRVDIWKKMKNNEINNKYWYNLPERLIAQEPANPRDSSKLLVYDTQKNELIIDSFFNLATYLPPSTALTLNDAKVVPARITLTKETGGKIVVLFLINEWISTKQGPIPCFLDRRGRVGDRLYFADKSFVTIQRQEEELFYVTWAGSPDDLLKKLDSYGTMPIPPYIKHSPLSRDELLEKYQTVFAQKPGSSAAPTASLHFTPRVFENLEKKGIKKQYITLHVGLGTFAPLTSENLRTKTLHHETYEIQEDIVRCIDTSKRKEIDITAVGTTVVRTLESVALKIGDYRLDSRLSTKGQSPFGRRGNDTDSTNISLTGSTDLFISPPFEFKVINHLITNFHLPGSSLMMLVDAFLASKNAKMRILDLYEFAIKNELRFYSFGDVMFIL